MPARPAPTITASNSRLLLGMDDQVFIHHYHFVAVMLRTLHRAPAEFRVKSFRRPGEEPQCLDAVVAGEVLDEFDQRPRMAAAAGGAIDHECGKPRREFRPDVEIVLHNRGRADRRLALQEHKGVRQPGFPRHRREQNLRLLQRAAGIAPEFLVRPFGDDRHEVHAVAQRDDLRAHPLLLIPWDSAPGRRCILDIRGRSPYVRPLGRGRMQLYWWPKTRSLRALWMLEE